MISFETTFLDYPNSEDVAVILFLSGCLHRCIGCQNPELQVNHDELTDTQENLLINELVDRCKRNETNKIVLSGGDPLAPCNRKITSHICTTLGNKYDICIYTGYEIEDVIAMNINGFKYIKCGKFDINNTQTSEKTDTYIQFVNKTQKLYDSEYKQLSEEGRFYF